MLAALLALLWLTAAGTQTVAAATKKAVVKKASSSKKAAPKKSTSAKAKTLKTATPAKKKSASVKKVSTSSKKKSTPTQKKARAVVPRRPAADLPPIIEASSAWQGCLNEAEIPQLAIELGIEQTQLVSLLSDAGLPNQTGACTPYVAATGGVENAALAMFPTDDKLRAETPVLLVHKTSEGITTAHDRCECEADSARTLTLPLTASAILPDDASVPDHIRWTAETLVPTMLGDLDPTAYQLRLVLNESGEFARLRSIELVEPVSGDRIDGAWWLERPDGPGVLIGMRGLDYEQLLWMSSVDYDHESRGLGPRKRTVKRKTKSGTVVHTVTTGGFHYGIDMVAPKGTPIHAVADGKVVFRGRSSGFGNLVIVDHGHGYTTYYAHMSKIEAQVGDIVPRGQEIGLVGSTGRSTAPHLHFEVRQNNKYIDPQDKDHQLDFWLLTPQDQVQLAKQMIAPAMVDAIVAAANAGATGIRAIQ